MFVVGSLPLGESRPDIFQLSVSTLDNASSFPDQTTCVNRYHSLASDDLLLSSFIEVYILSVSRIPESKDHSNQVLVVLSVFGRWML